MGENETTWPKDYWALAEFLGATKSKIRYAKWKCESELIEGEDFVFSTDRPTQAYINWLEPGAIKIAQHVRTPQAASLLENKGVKTRHPIKDEDYYLQIITTAIKGFVRSHRQYPIAGLKIDLYIPELRLAVECDERGHVSYPSFDHSDRESYIKQKLQCEFLRFNPNEADFNIGRVVNDIFFRIAKKRDWKITEEP